MSNRVALNELPIKGFFDDTFHVVIADPSDPPSDGLLPKSTLSEWIVEAINGRLAGYRTPNGSSQLGYAVPGTESNRSLADKIAETVSLKDFGAVGDGITDDSLAFIKFVQECMNSGLVGVITSGEYFLPNLSRIMLSAPISLIGHGPTRPILNAKKQASAQLFCLTRHLAAFENIEFQNFVDVFGAGDGTTQSLPNSVEGDVAAFSLSKISFVNCRRGAYFLVAKNGPTLNSLHIADCVFDGGDSGWAGFFIAWTNMLDVSVQRNTVRRINATGAGYTSSGTPQNTGNGRAILVGGNNPSVNYTMARWSVCDNLIEDVSDSRAKINGVNPEVGGIRITGVRFAEICRNRMARISSTGKDVDDDCEGIYPKAAYSIICNNVLDDVGLNGGAILVKGYNRVRTAYEEANPSADGWAGIMTGNIIRRSSGRACGIAIYSSDWIVENNYIEGCGGDTTRYAPIWVNADENDNVIIRGNSIKNASGRYGILSTCYGKNVRIEGNVVDGVLANLTGLTADHTYGIVVLNGNSNSYNVGNVSLTDMQIINNQIGRLIAPPTHQTRAIVVNSQGSPCERLRVCDNVIGTPVDVGLMFQSGQFQGLTIRNNDLRLSTTKYAVSGSPTITDVAASGNAGWLHGSLEVDPPNVEPLSTVEIGTVSVPNCITSDVVNVTSNRGLSGALLWARTTATGIVTIYLFNPTSTAINLPNSVFRVVVEKIVVN